MLVELLKPNEINGYSRKRFGKPYDGGYVIPENVISDIDSCITLGVGGDISFELDMFKSSPRIQFYLYDHTISSLPDNFINENFHFTQKMVSSTTTENSITISDIIRNHHERHTLLKCDIEGSEYEIFNRELNVDDIAIFILEMHDIARRYADAVNLLKLINDKFRLFHVHGNNYCRGLFKDPHTQSLIPDVIELTFINNNMITTQFHSIAHFPIKNIDFPNNPHCKELPLDFI